MLVNAVFAVSNVTSPKSTGDRDGDLDPRRNELGSRVDPGLEGLQVGARLAIELGGIGLVEEADRLGREVHVVAHVGHRRRRHLGQRAVLPDLFADASGHHRQRRHDLGRELLVAHVLR
ncbi:MAG: hypothetical protein ABI460_16330, partial [Caldimonas sp.]